MIVNIATCGFCKRNDLKCREEGVIFQRVGKGLITFDKRFDQTSFPYTTMDNSPPLPFQKNKEKEKVKTKKNTKKMYK